MGTRSSRQFNDVKQLPSGRWQGRYRTPDGVRRSAGTFATAREAHAAVSSIKSDIGRGTWRDRASGDVRFEAFAEQVLMNWSATLAVRTVAGYRSLLRLHLLPTFGAMKVNGISPLTVDSWYAVMTKDRSPVTVRNAYFLLSAGLCGRPGEPGARGLACHSGATGA